MTQSDFTKEQLKFLRCVWAELSKIPSVGAARIWYSYSDTRYGRSFGMSVNKVIECIDCVVNGGRYHLNEDTEIEFRRLLNTMLNDNVYFIKNDFYLNNTYHKKFNHNFRKK